MKQSNIIIAILVAGAVFGAVRSSQASILYPFAYSPDVPLNSTVSIEVRLDSEGQVVNAAEVALVYDPAFMEVTGFDRGSSWLTLWTDLPAVTSPGKILLSGGFPDGSVVLGGNVVTVVFRTLKTGPTSIAVQPALSGVYQSDSYATPTPLTGRTLALHIVDPLTLVSQPMSPSHPTEDTWFRDRNVTLVWTPYRDAVVSYRMSRDPLAVPDNVAEDNVGQTIFPSLADGLWYISFMERFPGQSWSGVYRREVRIDGTPPPPFEVSIEPGGTGLPFVVFNAVDNESGIMRYDVRIERTRWWTPWETVIEDRTVAGPLALTDSKHVTQVTVTAIDLAGNIRTASVNGVGHRDVNRVLIVIFSLVAMLGSLLLVVRRGRKRKLRRQPKARQ